MQEQHDINHDTYSLKNVIEWYDRLEGLSPAEKNIFEKFSDALPGFNVLDIGIGGGRTTSYLSSRCCQYIGIDYSEAFVNLCRQKFPGLKIELGDARDLSSFPENTRHLVNFSFNGIDYSNYESREKILSEIARVLKPGGVFFFSTHNRDHSSFNVAPWLLKNNSLFTNLKNFIKLLPFQPRKFSNRKKEVIAKEYAIINDYAHNYRLMTFYISPSLLRKQLEGHGFKRVQLHDRNGTEVQDSKLDDWIFVTCLKAG